MMLWSIVALFVLFWVINQGFTYFKTFWHHLYFNFPWVNLNYNNREIQVQLIFSWIDFQVYLICKNQWILHDSSVINICQSEEEIKHSELMKGIFLQLFIVSSFLTFLIGFPLPTIFRKDFVFLDYFFLCVLVWTWP